MSRQQCGSELAMHFLVSAVLILDAANTCNTLAPGEIDKKLSVPPEDCMD